MKAIYTHRNTLNDKKDEPKKEIETVPGKNSKIEGCLETCIYAYSYSLKHTHIDIHEVCMCSFVYVRCKPLPNRPVPYNKI